MKVLQLNSVSEFDSQSHSRMSSFVIRFDDAPLASIGLELAGKLAALDFTHQCTFSNDKYTIVANV